MALSLMMAHNNLTAGPWACLVLHAGRLDPFAQYTPVLLSHDAHVATALISVGMFLGVHVHSFHCFALVHVAQATQRLPGADSSSYRPPCSRTRLVRVFLNVVQSNRRDKPHSLHCQPPSSFCRPDPHFSCLPQSRLWASCPCLAPVAPHHQTWPAVDASRQSQSCSVSSKCLKIVLSRHCGACWLLVAHAAINSSRCVEASNADSRVSRIGCRCR